jgi:hypothetical protein
MAKQIRIIVDMDNQQPDKWSSTVFFMFKKADENHYRLEPIGLNQALAHLNESGVVDVVTGLRAAEPRNRGSIPGRARDSLICNTPTPAQPSSPPTSYSTGGSFLGG